MNDQTRPELPNPPAARNGANGGNGGNGSQVGSAAGSLEAVLNAFGEPQASPLANLQALVAALRPRRGSDAEAPTRAIHAVCHLLATRPELRAAFRAALLDYLAGRRPTSLYVDAGLYPNRGFFSEMQRRLSRTLLPEDIDDNYLRDVVAAVFDQSSDATWVAAVDEVVWQEFYAALALSELGEGAGARWMGDLVEALRVLSYRIAAIGLEPELLRIEPQLEAYESPFLGQNVEALEVVASWQRWLASGADAVALGVELPDDGSHLHVLFDQARKLVERVRQRASRDGTSLSLTLHLKRLTQNLDRAEAILAILNAWASERRLDAAVVPAVRLVRQLVVAECRKNDLRAFWRDSVELMARRVTDHAGRAGEHYITESRGEYFAMFRSAALAGFFIALMALCKMAIGKAGLAPLIEALAVCLNYGVGFVLIHIAHGTVATKQPAMTAAAIAGAIGEGSAGSARARGEAYDRLAGVIARTVRSQLVAILGNVIVVVPFAMLVGYALLQWLGGPFPDADKAQHLLDEIHPWHSGSLIFAAIAGVCLFLSGLISGYYDNLAAYNRIPQRLAALRPLRRLLGEARLSRVVGYVENNLGALAGNFFFGFLIGGVATFGVLFGLPLDIRHITFASANLGYAVNTFNFALDPVTLGITALGVGLIGLVNLVVSFSLSLWIACRSRQLSIAEAAPLTGRVWRLFRSKPREFFLPPRA